MKKKKFNKKLELKKSTISKLNHKEMRGVYGADSIPSTTPTLECLPAPANTVECLKVVSDVCQNTEVGDNKVIANSGISSC
jgi:hypothetical protein